MNLHYSQTYKIYFSTSSSLIPLWIYITLKPSAALIASFSVLYLYEFTLLSNSACQLHGFLPSYTSMNLHYSQTKRVYKFKTLGSYTSMNLHYSQTQLYSFWLFPSSYTSMNLHYSQTLLRSAPLRSGLIPLWIYITLKPLFNFSIACLRLIPLWIYITLKRLISYCPCLRVLYLYEFTLLSNGAYVHVLKRIVLYLYEFTLLSNLKFWKSSLQLVCKSTSLLYILIQ